MDNLHTTKSPNMILPDDRRLVDSKQLASLLGVKEGWVRQNMKIIPHFKMRRHVRFDPKVVMERFKTG